MAVSAGATEAADGTSLANALVTDRLEHRARRLTLVIAVLNERANGHCSRPLASALELAVAHYSTELSRIRNRLDGGTARRTLGGPRAP